MRAWIRGVSSIALESFPQRRAAAALSPPASALLSAIRQGLLHGKLWSQIAAGYRGEIDPEICGQVLKNVGESRLACCLFFWARRSKLCQHTVWSYQCFLEALLRSGGYVRVGREYTEMIKATGIVYDEYGSCLSIAAVCSAESWVEAFKKLKNKANSGKPLSSSMFNVVLESACKRGRWIGAADVFRYMKSVAMVDPDVTSYRILIDGFGAGHWIEEMETVFREMEDKKIEADESIYEALIVAYSGVYNQEQASKNFRFLIDRGWKPGVEIYSALLRCCLKNWDAASGYGLFREMESAGYELTGSIYDEMVHGFVNSRMFTEARVLSREMVSKGFKPCSGVYSALILAFACPPRVAEASEVFQEAIDQCGNVLDPETYSAFVVKLSRMDRAADAVRVYEKMTESEDRRPDERTFHELVGCLCRTGSVDRAQSLLNQLVSESESIVPGVETFNLVLSEYCCFGPSYSGSPRPLQMDKAVELLDEMVKLGRWPSSKTFQIVVHGLCKAGRSGDAYKLFLTIRDFDVCPDAATCKTVIMGLCGMGRIVEAELVFDHLLSDRREVKESSLVVSQVYKVIVDAKMRDEKVQEVHKQNCIEIDLATEGCLGW